LITC
jgi:hypothetical protein